MFNFYAKSFVLVSALVTQRGNRVRKNRKQRLFLRLLVERMKNLIKSKPNINVVWENNSEFWANILMNNFCVLDESLKIISENFSGVYGCAHTAIFHFLMHLWWICMFWSTMIMQRKTFLQILALTEITSNWLYRTRTFTNVLNVTR